MDRNELIYRILLGIKEGKAPKWTDFGITKDEFGGTVENMSNDKLIENATLSRGGLGNKVQIVYLNYAKLTTAGHEYIENY